MRIVHHTVYDNIYHEDQMRKTDLSVEENLAHVNVHNLG